MVKQILLDKLWLACIQSLSFSSPWFSYPPRSDLGHSCIEDRHKFALCFDRIEHRISVLLYPTQEYLSNNEAINTALKVMALHKMALRIVGPHVSIMMLSEVTIFNR